MSEYLERTLLLVGADGMRRLAGATVAVAGLGGVGGHCAEALARAGVGRLLLIDCDRVAASNLTRQLFATKRTVGMKKTDAAAERLREVSDCVVETAFVRIDGGTVADALPDGLDFIVDAIDDLSGKLALAVCAAARGVPIVSCMGAGNRLDASAFSVRDLYETRDCPLARRMRREARRLGIAFLPVVCSDETAKTAPGQRTIGSLAPVTGAAGLVLASYVLTQLLNSDRCAGGERNG